MILLNKFSFSIFRLRVQQVLYLANIIGKKIQTCQIPHILYPNPFSGGVILCLYTKQDYKRGGKFLINDTQEAILKACGGLPP